MKILSVSSYSISWPQRSFSDAESSTIRNAVLSDTRAACCMLWVTITIEYSSLSSIIRSSIFPVEIGSSAEQGSSIRITSGSTAIAAGDAESLLLAARHAVGVVVESVLDLVPERRALERLLDAVVDVVHAQDAGPKATLSKIDFGKGFGFWKTMPIRFRTSTGIDLGAVEVLAVVDHLARPPARRGSGRSSGSGSGSGCSCRSPRDRSAP